MIQRNKPSRKATYVNSRKAVLRQGKESFPDFHWDYYKEEQLKSANLRRNREINSKHQKYFAATSSKTISNENLSHTTPAGKEHSQKALFVDLHSKFRDDIIKFVYS